jgi:hypothetical protein
MAKLKCVPHKRRVLVLRASRNVIHRSDGSHCDTNKVEFNGRVMTPQEVGEHAGTG